MAEFSAFLSYEGDVEMKRRLGMILLSLVLTVVFGCSGSDGDDKTPATDVKQGGDSGDIGGGCTPSCGEFECGDDGCGGVCGTCGEQESCVAGICICQPSCEDAECGDDGCGGVCGYCLDNEQCVDGFCICQPACDGKVCGPDGCGDFCGDCTGSQEMCVAGACVCQPVCLGKTCGDDGCGGSCGECECGDTCDDGACIYHGCDGKVCGDDGCGVSCGDCDCGEECDEGACVFHACDGRDCGDDGCGDVCGICEGGNDECLEGVCTCIPDCIGRECGDDGCGGSCGECAEGIVCAVEGLCSAACSPVGMLSCAQPLQDDTSSSVNVYSSYSCLPNEDSGPELGYLFTPSFDGEVIFSVTDWDGWDPDVYLLSDPCGKDQCLAFGESEITYEVAAGSIYYVVVDGYNGTKGTFTLTATCTTCDPGCGEAVCGPDDCGGQCGVCPLQHVCDAGACICVPDCAGKQCGDDGCGGSCGECEGQCVGYLCHLGPGCEVLEEPFCGDCDCQACVCSFDAFCCEVSWDSICVGECIEGCGGCAVMDNCGDDVCEGYESCINCPEDCGCDDPSVCFQNSCCAPWCGGMNCGDDGCGGVCGSCDEASICEGGVCLQPDTGPGCVVTEGVPGCDGCECEECVCALDAWCCTNQWDTVCVGECTKECGACQLATECGNGLCEPGEDCGACPGDCPCKPGYWCNQDVCQEGECPTQCDGLECGEDGCGGVCGVCPDEMSYCYDGLCFADCKPVCEGKTCGDDACGGVCGECGEGDVCLEDNCCSPWCGGKNCGFDGCGGLCGECGEGEACTDGVCIAPITDPGCVATPDVPACAGCACQECVCLGDPYCCDTEWDSTCVDECTACGLCTVEYECGNFLCEPGESCGVCPGDCPCMPGLVCTDDLCVECVPNCDEKVCGEDGCGGSCGTCQENFECVEFQCIEVIPE